MIVCVPHVLSPEELRTVHNEIHRASFVDGNTTAGWSAREVKKNLQIASGSGTHTRLNSIIRDAFMRHGALQAAVLPAATTQVLLNRYDVGMQYGPHVDAPIMGGIGAAVRTDIAITIFLSDPKSYAGGELVVNSQGMNCEFKLDAGAAIVYPANSLHYVKPIAHGTRHAAIIWVQSQVRDAAQRELLWDLQNTKRQIFEREGKTELFDAISKSHANLLRMWADV